MGKRKLASVQYVHHITPIEGADRIECVHVLGWKCVANKGQFRVGDCCVYMEADSFLPICEQFEFLRSSSYETVSYTHLAERGNDGLEYGVCSVAEVL